MRRLYHQNIDEVPVAFHDAATYFSEEEWKLLHEWQKDLYRNVMKEIHQALLSLGPLIATTVMSLKDKENDVLCPTDHPDSETWHCSNYSPGDVAASSAVSFRIKGEGSQRLKPPQDTDKRETVDHVGTGHQFVKPKTVERKLDANLYAPDCFPAIHPDIIHSAQEEQELQFQDWVGSEESELNTRPTEGCMLLGSQVCWRKDEEYKAALLGPPNEGGEHSAGRSSEHEVISFVIKDEQEASSLDPRDVKKRQSFHRHTAQSAIISNQIKASDSFQSREKSSACKISSTKTNMDTTSTSATEASTANKLRPESYLEFGTEKAADCQTGFRNPAHTNLLHGIAAIRTSEGYDKSESNQGDAHFLPCLTKTYPVERLHTCSECKRSFSHKAVLVRHLRTHSHARPYACTECKKSFFKKGDFTRHRRTHTGEKPFMCIDCHKRFNRKGNLDQHRILIHSGVRPFKCSECEKSFSRQCDLAKHITKHRQINIVPLITSVR